MNSTFIWFGLMHRMKKGLHLKSESKYFSLLNLQSFLRNTLKQVLHLSIFSNSSSRDCWNLLLTVGAWYLLVTVLLFLWWPPFCCPVTSPWAKNRFDTIWVTWRINYIYIYCFFFYYFSKNPLDIRCMMLSCVFPLWPCFCSGWTDQGCPVEPGRSSYPGTYEPVNYRQSQQQSLLTNQCQDNCKGLQIYPKIAKIYIA